MVRNSPRIPRFGVCRDALVVSVFGFCLAACFAVVHAESTAYVDLPRDRLGQLVGIKGTCCAPGTKTNCSSMAPFVCATSHPGCQTQVSMSDSCGSPACQDSDDEEQACDALGFGNLSVTVTVCTSIANYSVACGSNGTHCGFTTSSTVVTLLGCGATSVCGETSGTACQ
jgi:hypothetical protein